MALIKCKECGKEISDKATTCPNCGCPVELDEKVVQPLQQPNLNTQAQQPVKRKKGHGCLITIIVFIAIMVVFSIAVSFGVKDVQKNPQKYDDSIAAKYIEVSDEEGSLIDAVLNDCGITEVTSFEHDELLDNAHVEGETGYRLAMGSIDNIILYLFADKSVNQIRYADYDLYADGNVVATLQDYTITADEASDFMVRCEDKVKELLKSPSTAKFPNILEWGFKKEKNVVTVQGYVDAQNGFGAEIRSEFQFIIDTDTNTIQSLIFDGQEMIAQ